MYFGILFLLIFIVPLLAVSWQMRKGILPYQCVLNGVIGVALAAVIIFVLASVSGQSLGQQLTEAVAEVSKILAGNEAMMKNLGMEALSVKERTEFITSVYGIALNALPSTILIWACIIAYFEYMFVAKIRNKYTMRVVPMPRIKFFCLPRTALTGFIIIFLLSWVATLLGIVPKGILTTNVNLIFEFILSVQGLAVVFYFFDSRRIPKIASILVGVISVLIPLGRILLFLLGLTDYIFALRNKISQK